MRIWACFAFLSCLGYCAGVGMYASGAWYPSQFDMVWAEIGGITWSASAGLAVLALRSSMRRNGDLS